MDKGLITYLQGQKVSRQDFSAAESKQVTKAPLVVLVNRGTAGPAEIVAAALQDDGRGDLVGERTFGEGVEHKTFDLPDGGAVILSVAKYASPGGKKFEDEAVTPKTQVASNFDLDDDGSDSDNAAPTSKPAPAVKHTQPDDQLSKALEMLKAKAA